MFGWHGFGETFIWLTIGTNLKNINQILIDRHDYLFLCTVFDSGYPFCCKHIFGQFDRTSTA